MEGANRVSRYLSKAVVFSRSWFAPAPTILTGLVGYCSFLMGWEVNHFESPNETGFPVGLMHYPTLCRASEESCGESPRECRRLVCVSQTTPAHQSRRPRERKQNTNANDAKAYLGRASTVDVLTSLHRKIQLLARGVVQRRLVRPNQGILKSHPLRRVLHYSGVNACSSQPRSLRPSFVVRHAILKRGSMADVLRVPPELGVV